MPALLEHPVRLHAAIQIRLTDQGDRDAVAQGSVAWREEEADRRDKTRQAGGWMSVRESNCPIAMARERAAPVRTRPRLALLSFVPLTRSPLLALAAFLLRRGPPCPSSSCSGGRLAGGLAVRRWRCCRRGGGGRLADAIRGRRGHPWVVPTVCSCSSLAGVRSGSLRTGHEWSATLAFRADRCIFTTTALARVNLVGLVSSYILLCPHGI